MCNIFFVIGSSVVSSVRKGHFAGAFAKRFCSCFSALSQKVLMTRDAGYLFGHSLSLPLLGLKGSSMLIRWLVKMRKKFAAYLHSI